MDFHIELFKSAPEQNISLGFFASKYHLNSEFMFIRHGMTVADKLIEDSYNRAYILAHELGHIWSYGAPLDWEDWLNETFAEYASMLFIESIFGYKEYENHYKRLKKYDDDNYLGVKLKTVDGTRPDHVHIKGAVMMHELRLKFGLDYARTLCKIFADLEVKNTKNFLLKLQIKGMEDVSSWIQDYI
jgi:hypothetical protein